MDEDLKIRFHNKRLDDFINDNIKPMPTMICEMERPEIIELIRKFILFSPHNKPLTKKDIKPQIEEKIDNIKRVKDYGDLYILVNPN